MVEGSPSEPENQAAQGTRSIGSTLPQLAARPEVQKVNHVLRVVSPPGDELDNMLAIGIKASDILALWHYTPEEWEHYVVAERARVVQMLKRGYLLISVPILLLVITVGVFAFVSAGLLDGIIGALWLGLPAGLFLGACVLWSYRTRVLWCDQLLTIPRQVLITRTAIVFGGPDYYRTSLNRPIKDFGSSRSVWVQSGEEPFLCFELTYYLLRSGSERIRVPIPAGMETEAFALINQFR